MKIKRLLISLVVTQLVTLSQAAFIANRDFLSVGHGARANGMGEAFVAVSDDYSAMFWNPAGLTQLKQDEVAMSYADRFDGLLDEARFHYVRRGIKAMYGIGYVGSYVKDIPVTQSLTQADLDAINTGTFAALDNPEKSVSDHALLFSYSRPLMPGSPHNLGTTVKLIYRDILGMVQGYGSAVDLGYHYIFPSERLRFGVNVQNAASITSFVGTIDNLKVKATATESQVPNVKTGLSYIPRWRVLNGQLMVAYDINMLTSFDLEDHRVGVEYRFGEVIALRAGKVLGRQDDSSEDYTMGMGVTLKNFVLDFSFLTNELGETTRGTLRYKLGSDYTKPRRY